MSAMSKSLFRQTYLSVRCPFLTENFVKSKNVTYKSCHICLSDDKNAFGVNPPDPGPAARRWRSPGGAPGIFR